MRGRKPERQRYPWGPLERRLIARGVENLGKFAGNNRTLWEWKRDGLTERHADHAAVRLGLHPGSIWPEWWDFTGLLFDELRRDLCGTRWVA